MGRLEGKVAIVTGGGTGIGEATCHRFGQEGARVAIFEIQQEAGEQTAGAMRAAGYDAYSIRVDVTQEDDVARAVAETVARFGGIDILVNNAAIPGANKLTHDLAVSEWEQVFSVNVRGPFLCSKHVLPAHDAGPARCDRAFLVDLRADRQRRPAALSRHQGRHPVDDQDGRDLLCALRHPGKLRASRLDQDAAVHQGGGDLSGRIRNPTLR